MFLQSALVSNRSKTGREKITSLRERKGERKSPLRIVSFGNGSVHRLGHIFLFAFLRLELNCRANEIRSRALSCLLLCWRFRCFVLMANSDLCGGR
jgi:hypothetical protein